MKHHLQHSINHFVFDFKIPQSPSSDFNIYQVGKNGVETKLQSQGGIIGMQSGTAYQVVMKLQKTTELQMYGVFIEYNVVQD